MSDKTKWVEEKEERRKKKRVLGELESYKHNKNRRE